MNISQSALIRIATFVMAVVVLWGSIFWGCWSFGGSLHEFSYWMQPLFFVYSLLGITYSMFSRGYDQEDSAEQEPVRVEVYAEEYSQQNYKR